MIIKTKICLVCFKTIKTVQNHDDSRHPISKFWGFAKEYLGISVHRHKRQFSTNGVLSPFNGKEAFCKNCEDLIEQICKLYHQLLKAQMHLSSKLGELSELVKHSEESVSYKLGCVLTDSLAKQLEISKAAHVDKLRKLLRKKCMQESCKSLPIVKIECMEMNTNKHKTTNDSGSDFSNGGDDEDFEETNNSSLYNSDDCDDDTVAAGRSHDSGRDEDKMESDEVEIEEQTFIKIEEESNSSYIPRSSSDSDFTADSDSEFTSERASIKAPAKPTLKNETTFACTSCPKVFQTLSKLSEHKRGVHSGLQFTSAECNISVKTKDTLRRHIQAIHNPETHVCPTCLKIFKTKKYLKEHIGQVHAGSSRRHRCPKCRKSYFKKEELKKHILKLHGKSFLKELETDGTFQEQRKVVNTPKKKNDGDPHPSVETKNIPCSTCPKEFQSASKLRKHKKEVHSGKQHLCAECGASFKSKGSLDKHTTVVHKPETHICPHCGKIFKFEKYFRDHIRRIHNDAEKMRPEKPIPAANEKDAMQECKICGMPMKRGFRKAMEMHMRTHMSAEEKMFFCDTTKRACKLHDLQFHLGIK